MMLLLSLLTEATLGQSTQQPSSGCMILTNSVTCPNQNGLAIATTQVYTNTQQFDAFVASRMDTNQTYVNDFRRDLACPEYDGRGQRFHMSMYCALLSATSAKCQGVADVSRRIPLCGDTCKLAAQSLSNLFQTVCTSNTTPQVLQTRDVNINFYNSFCGTLAIANPSLGQCLDSSTQPFEAGFCGFATFNEGQSYCAQSGNAQDPCCPRLSATPIASPTPVANNANNNQPAPLTSSVLFVTLLAIGIIIFLVTLFFSFRWAMAKRMNQSSSYPSPRSYSREDENQLAKGYKQDTMAFDPEESMPKIVSPRMDTIPSFVAPTTTITKIQFDAAQTATTTGLDTTKLSVMKVIAPYQSRMVDELTLEPGDKIQMLETYDDGWAYGTIIGKDETGTFPLVCTVMMSPLESP